MEQNTNTALLVMDMQAGIVAMLLEPASILEHVEHAIAAARKNKIPVIYVVVGFRNGAPEIGAGSSKTFAAGRERFSAMNMDEFMAVHPKLTPAEGEVTVVKRRVSAF